MKSSPPRQHHCKSSNFFSLNQQFHSLFSSFMSLSSMDRRCKPAGEIHVIVGPMFAGKTTALLRRIKSESNSGRNVAMIKSSKDTRYANDSLVTHDGLKFPCWALPDLSSFQHKLGDDAYLKLTSFVLMKLNFLMTFMISAARLLIMMRKL